MKEILFLIVLVAGLIWTVSSMRSNEQKPRSLSPMALDHSRSSGQPGSTIHPSSRLKTVTRLSQARGNRYERTNSKLSKAKNPSAGSGSAGDVAEIKKLTSIYATENTSGSAAAINVSAKSPSRAPVIPGVPARAYLLWKQNHIAYAGEVSPPPPNGLNVYVGCLDVKRGWRYTGERFCGEHLQTVKPQKVMDPLISRVGGVGTDTY